MTFREKMDRGGFNFIIGGLFTFIASVFIMLGISMMVDSHTNADDYEVVTATITYIDYGVFVNYDYDGKTYENVELNFRSSNMRTGDRIEIRVNKENPEKISAANGDWLGWLFVFFPLIHLTVGLLFLRKGFKESGRDKNLVNNGITIRAVVTGLHKPYVGMNRREYFWVDCVYHDPNTGFDHVFASNHIYLDNDYMENWHVGDTVNVLVDPQDYSHYLVDLSSKQSSVIS